MGAGRLGEPSTLAADEPLGTARPAQAEDAPRPAAPHAEGLGALLVTPTLQRLGRYVVLGVLGRGGMGVVLKGYDDELDRQVAIKVLHEHLGERHTARLRREAQAMAKLSHPNVVQVYEVGQLDGRTFVAMELVKGKTVRAWMDARPRPGWKACVEVFLQLGAGLSAAHAKGLVHRDFKPGNAILDEEGRARVLDFGLARGQDDDEAPGEREPAPPEEHRSAPLDVSLTETGAVLGTPAYMSLEQMSGKEVDARSDQFSFCVALYEAVYGQRPYEGDSLANLMLSIFKGAIRPAPRGSEVPAALRRVLLRGLASDPAQRWPSMEALLGELRALVIPRARRFVALSVAVGVLGLGGSWAVGQYVRVKDRCTGAEAKLAGIWDAARKQEVGPAILGTGVSYAPDTWSRVEARLDAYAERWTSKHTEVCEATAVQQAQSPEVMDLRMQCLDERRAALRAAVRVLADADATVVENAVQLVAGLPGLSRCDEVDALQAELPPPEDPTVAQEVQALRERLAELTAEQDAGRHAAALAEMEPVVARAQALGYAPLVAEAKLRRGALREGDGRYGESEQDLLEAYTLAMTHRHDAVARDAALRLTFVVGNRQARHAEGRVWGRAAVGHAEHDHDDAALATSLSNLGTVLLAQGEHEPARRDLERALSLVETARGADHPAAITILNNLGIVLHTQGQPEAARLYFERALQLSETTLGANHPHVAIGSTNLGNVLAAQGQPAQAKLHHERALRIHEEALGPDHPNVALDLHNLGTVLEAQGQRAQAKLHFERALRINERALGPDHPHVASTLTSLGNVLDAQGEHEQAERHHQRALRIQEQALGPDHPDVATILNNLGEVLHARGEHAQAELHYERARRVWEQALGPDHPDVAYPLLGLAKVALAQADLDSARAHAERAVAIREKADVTPADVAEARFVLAQALWPDASQRPRAHALAQQARDALAEQGPLAADALGAVDRWLQTHARP